MFEFFKIRGLYCLLAALTILFSASSAFAALCSSQPGNAPGDIMQAYVHFWDAGDNDFYPAFTINGAKVVPTPDQYGGVTYLPDNPGDSGSRCFSECWPIQFLARTSNVYFAVDVIGGNGKGWHCSIAAWVTGHDVGPIKSEKKQRALRNADFFEGLALAFGVVIPISCNVVLPEPYTCTAAMTGAPVSALVSWGFKRIAERDPWNGAYLWIDFPGPMRNPEELGLFYTDDYYQNQTIGDVMGVVQMIDFILTEVDKYESCGMANVDCLAMGVDHAAAIDAAFWWLGWYMNDMSNNAWVVAWIAEQNGGTAETVQAWRNLAQTAGAEGAGFQQ